MAALNFNAAEVEPQQSFDALPPGRYEAIISESEMKDTKAGTGQYLQLTFTVVGGQHEGRKLWSRLNLVNPNATAVSIAERELSPSVTVSASLCRRTARSCTTARLLLM
jgi:hypothetical protein